MLMSRGPSVRKLKPRSGRSSCGELTPRSKRAPTGRAPELVEDVPRALEAGLDDRGRAPKAASADVAAATASGSRSIPTTGDGEALRSPTGVTARTDGCVEDHPVRERLEKGRDLAEHDWEVTEGPAAGAAKDPRSGPGSVRWAHTQPLDQRCPGISPRVHRAGRVEKRIPGLPVEGLRIGPGARCDGYGHVRKYPLAGRHRPRAGRVSRVEVPRVGVLGLRPVLRWCLLALTQARPPGTTCECLAPVPPW